MTANNLRRVLSLGAVAGVLASSAYIAAPAWGTAEPPAIPPSSAPADETNDAGSGLSETALAEAVQRDLGLTPEQFAAAGELGTRAAAAATQLRDVPGFVGIRLEGGQIVVTGSGDELLGKVAALAVSIPELAVEAPAPASEKKSADAPPGSAPGSGTEFAVSTEQLFQAYVRQVGPEGLQAVMASGGKFVIRTGGINTPEATGSAASTGAESGHVDTPGKVSPAEFVAQYANVELDGGTHLAPEKDVPGGVGYIADTGDFGYVCSTGFSLFDPAGVPAVLSAGHCTYDGAAKTATLEFQLNRQELLGRFAFSQFGGPGNSRIIENPLDPNDVGNVGTDISVIESLNPELDPIPAASTWGDPSEPGPDVKIIGSADPVVGMPVCRSGRTSAWSCGTVDAVGIFVVPGHTYAADPTDLRAFNGFLSYAVQSSGGDSGGPYVSGNYAVGTHAAGDTPDENGKVIQNMAIAATLRDSLAVLPGYELEVFLSKPTVSTPAPGGTYEPGQLISGTVPAAPASAIPAGSTVRITIDGREDSLEVPLDAAGNWSFSAPENGSGALTFAAETVNGFSVSGISSFVFEPAPTEPPVSPAPDPDRADPPAPGPQPEPAPTEPAPSEPAPTDQAPFGPPGPSDGGAAVVPPPTAPAPVTTPPADLANTAGYNSPRATGLAYTGANALLPAAGAAAAAIAVGILLTVLVRRRGRLPRS